MIYQLEYKYPDTSIRLNTLKGMDLLRAQRLSSVGDQLGYTLYLANSEKQVHGYGESDGYDTYYDDNDERSSDDEVHPIIDVTEESLKLTTVVDTDGNIVVTDLNIEDENVLPWEGYEDRDPDRHEYDRWEGNSTHWFKDTVLFLIPNEYIADVFLGYGTSRETRVLAVLRHLAKRLRNIPCSQGEPLRKGLVRICFIISDNHVEATYPGAISRRYSDSTVSEAITVCAEFGLIGILPSLSFAFKDSLSANALESIRNLKHKMDWKLPAERVGLETM